MINSSCFFSLSANFSLFSILLVEVWFDITLKNLYSHDCTVTGKFVQKQLVVSEPYTSLGKLAQRTGVVKAFKTCFTAMEE